MNQCWLHYVSTVFTRGLSESNFHHFGITIAKMDFHGAIFTIIQSTIPSLVNQCGIVLLESRNVFFLATPNNRIIKAPKQSCTFVVSILNHTVSLFGPAFVYRTGRRIKKRFKFHPNRKLK